MDRKEHEKNTLSYYNQHASEFQAKREKEIWASELAQFQKLLPEGAILEVGCGTGNEALLLKEMGYDYYGTDISSGMLAEAKARCPEGIFVCKDLRSLAVFSQFDGLISIATLLHLEKEELTSSLSILRDQIRPGGIGLITLKEGVGTEIDTKGRFYSYYSQEELAKHITDAGFNIVDITIHPEKGHDFICCFIENP